MTELTARLLTYGETSGPDLFGDVVVWEAGSLALPTATGVPLFREHRDERVAAGRLLEAWAEDDAVLARFELLPTDAGAEAEQELLAGVRTAMSVGVVVLDATDAPTGDEHPLFGPTYRRAIRGAELVEVSQVLRGRMPSASVVDIIPEEGTAP